MYLLLGKLVPDSLVTDLMLTELMDIRECGWLLDGYPRTLSQAESLTRHQTLHSVIYLNVPFETIVNRVKDRWIHVGSGRVYNLSYNPPKRLGVDDVTGGRAASVLADCMQCQYVGLNLLWWFAV